MWVLQLKSKMGAIKRLVCKFHGIQIISILEQWYIPGTWYTPGTLEILSLWTNKYMNEWDDEQEMVTNVKSINIIQEVTTTTKIVLVFRVEKTIEFEAKKDRHRNMLIKFQKTN